MCSSSVNHHKSSINKPCFKDMLNNHMISPLQPRIANPRCASWETDPSLGEVATPHGHDPGPRYC